MGEILSKTQMVGENIASLNLYLSKKLVFALRRSKYNPALVQLADIQRP